MNLFEIKKGEILERPGEINSRVFEVVFGLLRSYAIDENGKEHIFMFATEGWIIADNMSAEEPCDLFINALEDTIVIKRKKNIEKVFVPQTEGKK